MRDRIQSRAPTPDGAASPESEGQPNHASGSRMRHAAGTAGDVQRIRLSQRRVWPTCLATEADSFSLVSIVALVGRSGWDGSPRSKHGNGHQLSRFSMLSCTRTRPSSHLKSSLPGGLAFWHGRHHINIDPCGLHGARARVGRRCTSIRQVETRRLDRETGHCLASAVDIPFVASQQLDLPFAVWRHGGRSVWTCTSEPAGPTH